jgi:hypothetical protein
MSCIRPYISKERSRRHGGVPESARIFEVSKKLQVLVANFAIERAIEIFTIDRGDCWSELREVCVQVGALDSGFTVEPWPTIRSEASLLATIPKTFQQPALIASRMGSPLDLRYSIKELE